MKRPLIASSLGSRFGLAATILLVAAGASSAQVLWTENFDGLAGSLGPSVNDRVGASRVTRRVVDAGTSVPIPNAFSHTAPGWTVNSSTYNAFGASVGNAGVPLLGDPNYGVDEWEGWSFANKDFWIYASGDQSRSTFTKASGNVAVADGDEWDDLRKDAAGTDIPLQGYMNTEMKSANINVSAYQGQTLTLTFDSSYDDESLDEVHPLLPPPGLPTDPHPWPNEKNNQGVVVAANIDGADVFLDSWDSVPTSGFFKDGTAITKNETLSYNLSVPAGATNVQLKFGYYNAANDWWWAIDNIALKTASSATVYSENFDAVPLGPSVNERNQPGGHVTVVETQPNTSPFANAFTHTAPAGWNVDNTGGLPGVGNPTQGTQEWEGWSFATPAFWQFVDGDGRQDFSKGTGVVAIADPDSWDNLGDPESLGTYNTLLVTPSINIAGVGAGLLRLAFDSSWRPEDTQKAIIEADYGSGFVPVLTWDSVAGPNFHDNNTNESVLLALNNPLGATSVKFRFGLVNATDDWWWALDNISVSAVPEPSVAALSCLAVFGVSLVRGRRSKNG